MTNRPHPRGSQARLERRGPAVEGFSTLTDSGVGLIIEHATTVDLADGQPLPPLIFDGVVWRVVRRLAGARTLWRGISLAENQATRLPQGRAGLQFRGGNHDPKKMTRKFYRKNDAKTTEKQNGHAQVQWPDIPKSRRRARRPAAAANHGHQGRQVRQTRHCFRERRDAELERD